MSPVVRQKGEKFTLPGKYLLFILTILCAGLMILTFSTDVLDKPVNAVAGYVIVPFQKGISPMRQVFWWCPLRREYQKSEAI